MTVDFDCAMQGAALSALDAAADLVGAERELGAQLRFVSEAEMCAVNAAQRGIDAATDVLSFPTISYPEGETALTARHLLGREYDPDMNACFLGDILICVEAAVRQAGEYGHALEREIAYLAVHGFAHLLGFDHEDAAAKAAMRDFEERALRGVGILRE